MDAISAITVRIGEERSSQHRFLHGRSRPIVRHAAHTTQERC